MKVSETRDHRKNMNIILENLMENTPPPASPRVIEAGGKISTAVVDKR